MFKKIMSVAVAPLLIMFAASAMGGSPAQSGADQSSTATQDKDATLRSDSYAALKALYAEQPKARDFAAKSKAILVFPNIVKAGLVVGGQGGNGVLIEHGKVTGVYNIAAASFGLQAGAQKFSQVMFMTTTSAVDYLNKSQGWSVGVGPSIVVVDTGAAKTITTQTLSSDVYVFIFGQHGLMGGLGVQGQKITKLRD